MNVVNRLGGAPTDCGETRRARRYSIVAPVRFRAADGEWLEGTTVNIGRLGLLIRTQSPALPSTRLNFHIGLEGDVASGPHVVGSGQVLRSNRLGEGGDTLMAVTIDEYQLGPVARGGEDD